MSILAQHIDTPDQRHRLTLLDTHRLRCLDCQRTLLLPSGVASTSTSQSPIPGPGDARCPAHSSELASGCRTCAADAKAHPDTDQAGRRQLEHQPTADVTARAAQARAALAAFPRRRTPIRYMKTDPERMAAARAELDQLRDQQR